MGFKVFKTRCDECLFSPNKIVSDRRRKEILLECRKTDTHFICHKATIAHMENPEADGDVCCRGFFDTNPLASNLMRIADRLKVIEFVDFSTISPAPSGTARDRLVVYAAEAAVCTTEALNQVVNDHLRDAELQAYWKKIQNRPVALRRLLNAIQAKQYGGTRDVSI